MQTIGRARQARPEPAAGPLPRGYIDTGDLMTTDRAQQLNRAGAAAVPSPTRVIPAPPVLPAQLVSGRPPVAPMKTVYVTINRPDGVKQKVWRDLVSLVDSCFAPAHRLQYLETSMAVEQPAVMWVVLVHADDVVRTQEAIRASLSGPGPLVRAIWAEATPRTIRVVE